MASRSYTLKIHDKDKGSLWAQVAELPGCFASGGDMEELLEAAAEAIDMYLTESTESPVSDAQGRIRADAQEPTIDLIRRRIRRLGKGSSEREARHAPREVEVVVEATGPRLRQGEATSMPRFRIRGRSSAFLTARTANQDVIARDRARACATGTQLNPGQILAARDADRR